MNGDRIREIANAVLYEGYILYPYRPSSIKNRQRWTFGGVFPQSFSMQSGSDPWTLQCECLLRGTPDTIVNVHARFLHLIVREITGFDASRGGEEPETSFCPVANLEIDGCQFAPWEEAVEREIEVADVALSRLLAAPQQTHFSFPKSREREILRHANGKTAGAIVRTGLALEGTITLGAEEVSPQIYRLRARVENTTPITQNECENRELAQRRAFASTHAILRAQGGDFLSLTDPPQELIEQARACVNEGCWPVLVGREGAKDALLASPIILYDYPQIAPESPGDLFDGCEIDEILTLRILTMTDAEKAEAAAADPRTRALLERTEALTADDMAKMHGALRSPRAFPKPELVSLHGGGAQLCVGARVRLKPKGRSDIMDIVLDGKIAIIEAIERDFEDRVHVAVTVEDDPGRDLGLGRFPGHRFFFSSEELEAVGEEVAA
ncbi:MAG TPA: hypothetical protein VH000_02690 [Rhizomicrobium sp.]|nr:hypothetical protein [Rhizomicrobium sp.]